MIIKIKEKDYEMELLKKDHKNELLKYKNEILNKDNELLKKELEIMQLKSKLNSN